MKPPKSAQTLEKRSGMAESVSNQGIARKKCYNGIPRIILDCAKTFLVYHLRGAAFWHHSSPTTLPFVRLRLLSSGFRFPPRKRAKDAKANGKKSVELAQICAKKCIKMRNVRTFQNCTTSVFESLPQAFLSETKQFRSLAKRWQDRSGKGYLAKITNFPVRKTGAVTWRNNKQIPACLQFFGCCSSTSPSYLQRKGMIFLSCVRSEKIPCPCHAFSKLTWLWRLCLPGASSSAVLRVSRRRFEREAWSSGWRSLAFVECCQRLRPHAGGCRR